MIRAPISEAEEAARLRRLAALDILDSGEEAAFDQITTLASQLCGWPIAVVTLVDATRQWFKAQVGLDGVRETPREMAFCAHTVAEDALLEVRDALLDPRFAANPLVVGEPRIRAYAGVPLTLPAGERVGALCLIDRTPRELTEWQRQVLTGLGRLAVTALLERERRVAALRDLEATQSRYRLIVEGQSELVSLADAQGVLSFVNEAYARFFGLTPAEMIGRPLTDFVDAQDRDAVLAHLQQVLAARSPASGVNRMVSAHGEERWVAWTNRCVPTGAGGAMALHSVGRDITEQRHIEAALERSELASRLMYEATPAMLHSIGPDGRLLNVSDMWLRKLGYERADVIGRRSSDFLAPESERRARETVLPAFMASGRCDDVPYRMLRRDGSVLDVTLSAVLERDAAGRPVRSLAVLTDMTVKLATDAALDHTSRLLRLVLDNLPARVSYWGADHRLRFANDTFLRWVGHAGDSAVGKLSSELLAGPWFAALKTRLDACLAGQALQFESASTDAVGARRDTDVRLQPDRRDGGEVVGLFVFALDISERREAERLLAEQQQRFKLLIDGVREYAIYVLDPQGHVSTWNAGAERSKGYTADEVLGRHYGLFFLPEDLAAGVPDAHLAKAAEHGSFAVEGWRRRRDGSRFLASVVLTPLRDGQQQLIGFAKITRDLTEDRRQRHELERALADKETLLKEVYHRVKNNLQVVQSLLNLQRQALPAGPARTPFEESIQRVRAMALVHEKLYQSGNLAAVSLSPYTQELVQQIAYAHGAVARHIVLHARIAEVETGLDNAVPFGLLLTELLSNCMKHAFPAGRPGRVRVSLERRADGDLLEVADDGIGLPAGFDPEARSASMGLQLASGLARQLGGELAWRSEGGAVMCVLLRPL